MPGHYKHKHHLNCMRAWFINATGNRTPDSGVKGSGANHYPRAPARVVYNSVSQQHIACWNMSRIIYTSLYLFNKCVKSVNCLWIWKVAKCNQALLSKCKTVARILISSGCIFYSFSGDNVQQIQLCSLCASYERLTVAHALLSCASLEPLRSVSWATATQSMPGPLAELLASLCDNEKMIMLLSGLNCPYIPEWQVINEDIITLLATMYTKFKADVDRLW